MQIPISFRVVTNEVQSIAKRAKNAVSMHSSCHQLLSYINKHYKPDVEFVYPEWNPEDVVDRISVEDSLQSCRNLGNDRLWFLLGTSKTPKSPPMYFISSKSMEPKDIVVLLQKTFTHDILTNVHEYITKITSARSTVDSGDMNDDNRNKESDYAKEQERTMSETILEAIPEVFESVKGVLEDTREDMNNFPKAYGSTLGATVALVNYVSLMKEQNIDWESEVDAESVRKDIISIGTLIGAASAIVTRVQGITEDKGKRLIKHLLHKPARKDGKLLFARKNAEQNYSHIKRYDGNLSAWLS